MKEKMKLIKHGHSYALLRNDKLIAFAHPEDFTNDNVIGTLSLKNCQTIERGYDLDELAKEHLGNPTEEELNKVSEFGYALYNSNLLEFKKGFQKALEILGDKKFSLEQMLVAYNTNRSGTLFDQLINSFGGQQTEWDVEIEMEEVAIGDKYTPEPKPKLDADGCLILKLKSK